MRIAASHAQACAIRQPHSHSMWRNMPGSRLRRDGPHPLRNLPSAAASAGLGTCIRRCSSTRLCCTSSSSRPAPDGDEASGDALGRDGSPSLGPQVDSTDDTHNTSSQSSSSDVSCSPAGAEDGASSSSHGASSSSHGAAIADSTATSSNPEDAHIAGSGRSGQVRSGSGGGEPAITASSSIGGETTGTDTSMAEEDAGGSSGSNGSGSEGHAGPGSQATFHARLQQQLAGMDGNQLQTSLVRAIAAEDYDLARAIRDRLGAVLGAPPHIDWHTLGLLDWLLERAQRLGFRFPTEVQQRAARVVLSGADAVLQSETGSGKTLAFLLPALSRLDFPPALYPDDLRGPQLLLVVPTFELGVQAALLVYKLFGGSVSSGMPGDPANMFTYTGPRGIMVKGVLREEEVELAKRGPYLNRAHVIVATPRCLQQLVEEPRQQPALLQHCKVLVVDEVDECLATQADALNTVLSNVQHSSGPEGQRRTQVVFVGATVAPEEVDLAVQQGWLVDPVHVRVGQARSVPTSLQHRYVVCGDALTTPLSVLTRMLRRDLAESDKDAAPARVMVFADSEEDARDMADPLRTVLWQEHRLSVLLPTGSEPVQALHAFRDNHATLLLCTPAASRGLDLPAVSHVYNVGPPPDATQYLHRAGRTGRIGATGRGIVTTIVTLEQEAELLQQARQLGIQLVKQAAPSPTDTSGATDTEAARKGLEDLFNLY